MSLLVPPSGSLLSSVGLTRPGHGQAPPSLRDLFGDTPGIRGDIPNSVYHADRSCISASGLKAILRSPAHFRQYLDGPRKLTPDLMFGAAFHAFVLEPDVFATEYIVGPDCSRRTKAFTEFVEAHPTRTVLTVDQYRRIEAMALRIQEHQGLRDLLDDGLKEATIIWQDQNTGLWLKCRPDCLNTGAHDGICLDLKSTDNASRQVFWRSCLTYDYDLQAAHYLAGLSAFFGRDFDFAFGPAEKESPHCVALLGAPAEMLARGQRRRRQALQLLKPCMDNDYWPGYQPDGNFDVLPWPRWAN